MTLGKMLFIAVDVVVSICLLLFAADLLLQLSADRRKLRSIADKAKPQKTKEANNGL